MANPVMEAPIIPENLSWEDYNLIADAMKLLAEIARTEGLSSVHITTLVQNDYMKDWLIKLTANLISEETINSYFSTIRKISLNDFIALGVLMLRDGYRPDQIHWFLTTIGDMHQRVTK